MPGPTDAFIHRVSEELRTPLTIATGMLHVCRRRHPLGDDDGYLLDRGEAALDRMARLIDDLVLASRLASGAHVPARDPVPARALLLEVAATTPDPRHVQVECDPHLVLHTDGLLLGRALSALVDNALVHAGAAQVVARPEAVEVCDPGPGLPAGVLDRLRPDGVVAGSVGPGVGLDLVQALAEHLGASLTVQRAPAAGTVVRLALPS